MIQKRNLIILTATILALGMVSLVQAAGLVSSTEFGADNEIIVNFSQSVDGAEAGDPGRYIVYEEADPDMLPQQKTNSATTTERKEDKTQKELLPSLCRCPCGIYERKRCTLSFLL